MARLFFTKEMTKQLKANRSSSISFLLVFSFGVSLFWCNDGNRFQIRANDNQGASVGSLQDLQACSQQNALDVSSSDCSCICHVPMIAANTFVLLHFPVQLQPASISIPANSSDFSNRIFRPPIASWLRRFSFLSDWKILTS